MKPESFIEEIRLKHIENLVKTHEEILSSSNVESSTDFDMKLLISAWQTADTGTKSIFSKSIQLGSQNSIVSFLNHIDTGLV